MLEASSLGWEVCSLSGFVPSVVQKLTAVKLQFLPRELGLVCAGIPRVLCASHVMSCSLTLSTSTKMEKFTVADTTLSFSNLDVQPAMR